MGLPFDCYDDVSDDSYNNDSIEAEIVHDSGKDLDSLVETVDNLNANEKEYILDKLVKKESGALVRVENNSGIIPYNSIKHIVSEIESSSQILPDMIKAYCGCRPNLQLHAKKLHYLTRAAWLDSGTCDGYFSTLWRIDKALGAKHLSTPQKEREHFYDKLTGTSLLVTTGGIIALGALVSPLILIGLLPGLFLHGALYSASDNTKSTNMPSYGKKLAKHGCNHCVNLMQDLSSVDTYGKSLLAQLENPAGVSRKYVKKLPEIIMTGKTLKSDIEVILENMDKIRNIGNSYSNYGGDNDGH